MLGGTTITLTRQEAECFELIKYGLTFSGRAPSRAEIGDELGIGKVQAARLITRLCRKGVIRKTQAAHFNIELVEPKQGFVLTEGPPHDCLPASDPRSPLFRGARRMVAS
jgi:SOS-response transcriptional repressor LexA